MRDREEWVSQVTAQLPPLAPASSPSDLAGGLALRLSPAVPWSCSQRTLVQSPAPTWQRQHEVKTVRFANCPLRGSEPTLLCSPQCRSLDGGRGH